MIRSIIVDDEPQGRQMVTEMLSVHHETIEVVDKVKSVKEAVDSIHNLHPDLVFLDIQLIDGSGFDVLEQTTDYDYNVIFITAYNEYAINAFRVNALDYLLKPLNEEEFAEAIKKVRLQDSRTNIEQLKPVPERFNEMMSMVSFATSEGHSLHHTDEIVRCESDNNYSKIYFTSGEQLYLSKTLMEVERQLNKYGFERIHRSHLVNIKHLKKYLNKDGGYIQMSDNSMLPVAKRKKAYLISLFEYFKT